MAACQLEHSYTAVDGAFDTGVMQPGETTTVTAPDGGLVRVYCTIHSSRDGEGMAGLLLVDGEGDGAAGADTSNAELASATTTTAIPVSWTANAIWPLAAAVALGAAALAIALRTNRRVTAALRD